MEAVRAGFLIARSRKAANAWATRKAQSARGGRGLTGGDLDQVVKFIGMRNPGKVKQERLN